MMCVSCELPNENDYVQLTMSALKRAEIAEQELNEMKSRHHYKADVVGMDSIARYREGWNDAMQYIESRYAKPRGVWVLG